jgi:hypothetical protein
MIKLGTLKTLGAAALLTVALALPAAAQNKFGQPKSIIHVVTVLWKADATEAQKTAAIEGVKKMAAEIPGITNIWTKKIKVQGRGPDGRPYDTVFVMEFKDQAAFDAYGDHPAHKAWEKIYLPIRQVSTTHDVTN